MVQGDLDLFEQVPPYLDHFLRRGPGRRERAGHEGAELVRGDAVAPARGAAGFVLAYLAGLTWGSITVRPVARYRRLEPI
jgi:hypothetical protein